MKTWICSIARKLETYNILWNLNFESHYIIFMRYFNSATWTYFAIKIFYAVLVGNKLKPKPELRHFQTLSPIGKIVAISSIIFECRIFEFQLHSY